MTLRETVHQSIDELDNEALAVIYEQIKLMQRTVPDDAPERRAATIDELWELGRSDTSCWSDDIIAAREDRL